MRNHELNLWHAHQQAIAHVILIRSFSCVLCAAYAKCDTHLQVVHRCFFVLSWCCAYAQTRLWWPDVNLFVISLRIMHRRRQVLDVRGIRYAIFKVQPDAKNLFQPPAQLFQPPTNCTPILILTTAWFSWGKRGKVLPGPRHARVLLR